MEKIVCGFETTNANRSRINKWVPESTLNSSFEKHKDEHWKGKKREVLKVQNWFEESKQEIDLVVEDLKQCCFKSNMLSGWC